MVRVATGYRRSLRHPLQTMPVIDAAERAPHSHGTLQPTQNAQSLSRRSSAIDSVPWDGARPYWPAKW
jgi:hypothetical protein